MPNHTSFHNVESVTITGKSDNKHGGENRKIEIEMSDSSHTIKAFFNEEAEVTIE